MNKTNDSRGCIPNVLSGALYPQQSVLLEIIILIQIIGIFSNILCVQVVRKMRSFTNRPRLLMANISLSDTVLTLVTIIPRYLVIMFIKDDYPLATYIIQSIRYYLENLSLYAEAFIMVTIVWDRYYALIRVFNNPFDDISVKLILTVVWTSSAVLSIPFLITSDIDYYDFNTTEVICIPCNKEEYLNGISNNKVFALSKYLTSIILEFIVPTLIVAIFSIKIIFHLFEVYRNNIRGIPITTQSNRCEVTKRLLSILLVFVVKNTAYILITYRTELFEQNFKPCPDFKHYFTYYEIFRLTTFLNSIIFFWMSTEFRTQFRNWFSDTRPGTESRRPSRDTMISNLDNI